MGDDEHLQPRIVTASGEREMTCFPAAVVVLLINEREELLQGFHRRRQRWESVSGLLEAGESLLDGALRELREEMGASLRAHPVGVIHAGSFHYDRHAPFTLSITWLMSSLGGEVVPGDDMCEGMYRWAPLQSLIRGDMECAIPTERWQLRRALEAFRLWRGHDDVLQRPLPAPE